MAQELQFSSDLTAQNTRLDRTLIFLWSVGFEAVLETKVKRNAMGTFPDAIVSLLVRLREGVWYKWNPSSVLGNPPPRPTVACSRWSYQSPRTRNQS